MSKKQRLSTTTEVDVAIYNDLRFPKTTPGADYDSKWTSTFTATDLYKVLFFLFFKKRDNTTVFNIIYLLFTPP